MKFLGSLLIPQMQQDLAVTLMNTPGYFTALYLVIHAIFFSENPFYISP